MKEAYSPNYYEQSNHKTNSNYETNSHKDLIIILSQI